MDTCSLETMPIREGLQRCAGLGIKNMPEYARHVVKSRVIIELNPKEKFDLGVLNKGVIGLNRKNTRPNNKYTRMNLTYHKQIRADGYIRKTSTCLQHVEIFKVWGGPGFGGGRER